MVVGVVSGGPAGLDAFGFCFGGVAWFACCCEVSAFVGSAEVDGPDVVDFGCLCGVAVAAGSLVAVEDVGPFFAGDGVAFPTVAGCPCWCGVGVAACAVCECGASWFSAYPHFRCGG